MRRIIYLFIILLVLNNSQALTDLQRESLEKTLDLANDEIKYERLLKLLNDKRVDLSDEPELSNRILSKSIRFGINPLNYKNIKFTEPNTLHSLEINESDRRFEISDTYNFQYSYLIGFLIFIILIFLIYKNKDKFKKEEISDTEKQLKDFIKNAEKQGQSKEEIKQELLNSGWPEELIDKYL